MRPPDALLAGMVIVVAATAATLTFAADRKQPLTETNATPDGGTHRYHARPRRYLTIAKESVTMGFVVEWRIADADRFAAAGGSVDRASCRLADLIEDRLRDAIGGMRADTVRESLPLLAADTINSSRESAERLGVEITRVDLNIP